MDAVEIAESLIKRFEGFRSHPYLCPAGIPTIGYGATFYQDGTHVTLKDSPITEEQGRELLVWMVKAKYLPEVARLCPHIDTEGRMAALIDFTYNLGGNALRHSTLRRRVNSGRWNDVPHQLRRWVHGGGRVLPGLVKRRNAEALLIP